jgi:hypothetical protein
MIGLLFSKRNAAKKRGSPRWAPDLPKSDALGLQIAIHICFLLYRAEAERFELSVPFGTHAFQACALDHYATPPLCKGPLFVTDHFVLRQTGGNRRAQDRNAEGALWERTLRDLHYI